jgi:hypothetical protein
MKAVRGGATATATGAAASTKLASSPYAQKIGHRPLHPLMTSERQSVYNARLGASKFTEREIVVEGQKTSALASLRDPDRLPPAFPASPVRVKSGGTSRPPSRQGAGSALPRPASAAAALAPKKELSECVHPTVTLPSLLAWRCPHPRGAAPSAPVQVVHDFGCECSRAWCLLGLFRWRWQGQWGRRRRNGRAVVEQAPCMPTAGGSKVSLLVLRSRS